MGWWPCRKTRNFCYERLHALDSALRDHVRIIAAFEEQEEAAFTIVFRKSEETPRHPTETLWRDATLTEWIALDCVEACGSEDRFWVKSLQQRTQNVAHDVANVDVAKTLLQRNVDRVAPPCVVTSVLQEARSWEEAVVTAVHAEEKHTGVF